MSDLTSRLRQFYEQRVERPDSAPRDDAPGVPTSPATAAPASDAPRPNARRRRLLAAGGATATGLLAGCSGLLPGKSVTPPDNSSASGTTPTRAGKPTPDRTPTPEPPEVNVGGIQYESSGRTYTFRVTLDHDGERGGADWWQVETLEGERLFRRTFSPARTNERFTTGNEFEIPEGVTAVVVRGHDSLGGYGGRAMLANLETGATAMENQGPEKRSFADYSF